MYQRHDDELAAESNDETEGSLQYRLDWCPLQFTAHDTRYDWPKHQHGCPEGHVKRPKKNGKNSL